MMRHSIFAIFAAVSLLWGGCATKPGQPDWIYGDSNIYPATQYLLGRGQASTQEEARDRARADLAKIFQVAVTVDNEDVQHYKSDTADSGSSQYAEQTTRRISTRTDQIVSGIQIAQLWQDSATKSFHALAILPRMQSATGLRQQINQLDEATRNYIEQSRNSSDLFLKIAAANMAVDAQQQREVLQKSLQVVDISGRGLEPTFNSAMLKADLGELLKRVRIASIVTSDSVPGLDGIVAGALAKSGFMIETGQHPDFILQGKMILADIGPKDGWYWQRGNLEITLSESMSGRVRGTRRWPIKGSAINSDTAIKRAMDQADADLKQDLKAAIISMVTNK